MKRVIVILLVLMTGTVSAQEWMELISQPDANFYEVQDAFNEYWDGKEPVKGQGIKQFKRWEWFMQNRVDDEGNQPSMRHVFTELDKVKMQRQHRASGNWEQLGPIDFPTSEAGNERGGIGRITVITFHPTDTMTMYAGAPSGGLYKTIDGGESWTTNTDHLPNLGVSDLLIHPHNDSILYMSTGDGSVSDTYSYGLLKSIDGGETWDSTGLSFEVSQGMNIHDMAMDTANPERLLAATTNGIYRSWDGGDTWSQHLTSDFHDIQYKPGSSDTIYAASNGGTGGRVYRSVDAGLSWDPMLNGFPTSGPRRIKIGLTPADPNRIYAACSNSAAAFYGLYVSYDAAESWEELVTQPNMFGWSPGGSDDDGVAWYAMDIAVSNTDPDEVRIGAVNMWKSTDGGHTFEIEAHWTGGQAYYIHADHHFYGYHPITNRFYVGSDGGVTRKADDWDGFDIISDGIAATQFYRLSVSDHNPDLVSGGTQDNGTMIGTSGDWNIVLGGDGMETIISHASDLEIYATNQYGSFYRSVNGGESFSGNLAPETGPWVTSYVQDPVESSVIYCGIGNVYRSDNNGGSWFEVSPDLTSGSSSDIRDIKIFHSDPEVILANTDKRLWRTENITEWEVISNGLPQSGMSSFAVNPYDKDEIWVVYSRYVEDRQVYRTLDGGETWDNMSLNLPALPVNCITIEKSHVGGVYIGTDVGVYYIDNSLDLWEPFMDGLPNVIVNELEIQDEHSQIVAATYGRGMWKSDTWNPINIGIEEDRLKHSLQIAPNPTTGAFRITCPNKVNRVVLLDAYGKKVREYEPNDNFVVATSIDLPSGIYYLQAHGINGPIIDRLVVRH